MLLIGENGLGPLHIVSAWASDRGITLGQVATADKSNEITAIPQLLGLIEIEDAVVTIDAAGCQKNIAAHIVDGKGDYVLALKGNQGRLFDDVRLLLDGHLHDDFADCPVSRYVEAEEGHGRLEERLYYQIAAPHYLHGLAGDGGGQIARSFLFISSVRFPPMARGLFGVRRLCFHGFNSL